ncbi:MAG TPA: glycoside hydrolase family 3 N-terminal domain-containing protein [Candidatus Dormibacteraeota bacterium]|nr:glycoside hydrolase family 3 N-terminal domain-containing protein [Candidatus Dormibacteraeota bacterium]
MPDGIERLALRCILPGFVGTVAPDWVLGCAARGLGGVVLYSRNILELEQLMALTGRLHAERPELIIGIDEEGGDVTRLEAHTGSSYPGNLALGAAGDVALTRRVGAAIGAELAAAGVDLDLAPDADVNTNPSNPVIGVRAFGSNPTSVAAHTAAWIEGIQGAGVAACAKHFPGHGDTSVDSHLALPVVEADPHDGALQPFDAAIRAGVRAVMSAHIVVRPIDTVPATVSHAVMTGLLRDELGFSGVAITDGLEMRGLSDGVSVEGAGVDSLIAGCDALCVGGGLAGPEVVEQMVAAIVEAVAAGRLTEERLAEAAARVDALARWRRAQPPSPPPDREAGMLAARRALSVEGPVRIGDEALILKLDRPASIAAGPIPWGLEGPLEAGGVHVERIEVSGRFDPGVIDSAVRGRSLVVEVRDLHRDGARLNDVEALLSRHPDAVLVEMGFPACRPRGARAYIATRGSARVNALAAAEMMHP